MATFEGFVILYDLCIQNLLILRHARMILFDYIPTSYVSEF